MLAPARRLTAAETTADFTKLQWGQAYEVAKADGTWLHCSAPLLAGVAGRPYWIIYEAKREAMAADGLVFHKAAGGTWHVLYKTKVGATTYKKKAGTSVPKWAAKLQRLARKYST